MKARIHLYGQRTISGYIDVELPDDFDPASDEDIMEWYEAHPEPESLGTTTWLIPADIAPDNDTIETHRVEL